MYLIEEVLYFLLGFKTETINAILSTSNSNMKSVF